MGSFWALMGTQFFGAFNDNIFKFSVAFFVTAWVKDAGTQGKLVYGSGLIFAIPFLIFSLGAGRLADRASKSKIALFTKIFEVLVVCVAVGGMALKNIPIMFIALFMLAMQSAFFGPSKYGMLPELFEPKNIPKANGYLNALTIIAILAGTISASVLTDHIVAIAFTMFSVSLLGLICSMYIGKLTSMNPSETLSWNAWKDFGLNWKLIENIPHLKKYLVGSAFFWFIGAVLQLNLVLYVENILIQDKKLVGIILFVSTLGIALGSILSGKISRKNINLRLVPGGLSIISLFTVGLFFSRHSILYTLICTFFIGLGSGIYLIPLVSLIQILSPEKNRGRVVALSNFLSFVAVFLAALFPFLLRITIAADAATVFLLLGLLTSTVTIIILLFIPEARNGIIALAIPLAFVGMTHAASTFEQRCAGPGVLQCVGFDSEKELTQFDMDPAWDGKRRAKIVSTPNASGTGSLQFEIPPRSKENTSGSVGIPMLKKFGPHSTFYVQFRQRFSKEMFNKEMTGNGWKQVLFVDEDLSCANVEIATQNSYLFGYPTMYDRCGKGFQFEIENRDWIYQWSEDWPENKHPHQWVECHYHNQKPPPDGGCFFYKADDWMTFYYEVHIGDWGKPNSYVKAWISYEGMPLKQFINMDPWTAYPNAGRPNSAYRRVLLLPYNTDKNPNADHPTAYTWYDELIISTEPIADPH